MFQAVCRKNANKILSFTLMRSKAYIPQNFCIIGSMKLYNEGFPFLYNTFYQEGPKILPGGGIPGYASGAARSPPVVNVNKDSGVAG